MPYQRRTLADLLAQLKSDWDQSPFWTDEEGRRYINHSLRTWNLLTGFWKRKVLVPSVAGSHYLSLPSSITFGMQVVWGPIGLPLQITSTFGLDQAQPRWEEETTASGGTVPTTPILWAPNGLREIVLWPAPATGSLPVLVDGVSDTPVLVNLADFVDITDRDADSIVHYALHIATFKKGAPFAQATGVYLQDFFEAATEQNARLRHSTMFRKFLGLDRRRDQQPVIGVPERQQQAQARQARER